MRKLIYNFLISFGLLYATVGSAAPVDIDPKKLTYDLTKLDENTWVFKRIRFNYSAVYPTYPIKGYLCGQVAGFPEKYENSAPDQDMIVAHYDDGVNSRNKRNVVPIEGMNGFPIISNPDGGIIDVQREYLNTGDLATERRHVAVKAFYSLICRKRSATNSALFFEREELKYNSRGQITGIKFIKPILFGHRVGCTADNDPGGSGGCTRPDFPGSHSHLLNGVCNILRTESALLSENAKGYWHYAVHDPEIPIGWVLVRDQEAGITGSPVRVTISTRTTIAKPYRDLFFRHYQVTAAQYLDAAVEELHCMFGDTPRAVGSP